MYGFRKPMLAHKLEDKLPKSAVAELKYDGHRLIIEKRGGQVKAWSRAGNYRDPQPRPAIVEGLLALPDGVYDGEEYVPGGTSQHVKDLMYRETHTHVVLFDILTLDANDVTSCTQAQRRVMLERAVRMALHSVPSAPISISNYWIVKTMDDVMALATKLWSEKQEGLIIKDTTARYECGKRRRSMLKLKQEHAGKGVVVGFEPSKGEINDRGPCGTTILRDSAGRTVRLKTLDDATCRVIEADPSLFIGRVLLFDYTEMTPDDEYRHARWDRWEDE